MVEVPMWKKHFRSSAFSLRKLISRSCRFLLQSLKIYSKHPNLQLTVRKNHVITLLPFTQQVTHLPVATTSRHQAKIVFWASVDKLTCLSHIRFGCGSFFSLRKEEDSFFCVFFQKHLHVFQGFHDQPLTSEAENLSSTS